VVRQRFLCNFAMVEAVMAQLHEIEDSQRTAFASRIKHMQRLGFPEGTRTGKGRPAGYGAQQLYLIGFALELAQLGLATDAAIPLIQDNMETITRAAAEALDARFNLGRPPIFIYFDPARLDPLMSSRGGGMVSIRGKFRYSTRDFGDLLLTGAGAERRFTVLAVSLLIEDIAAAIINFEPEEEKNFLLDLADWSGCSHD
jgi:hypothetical protein